MTTATQIPDAVAPSADADFLDQGIASAIWGLETAVNWTSDKLVKIAVAVFGFSIHHWMLLLTILIGCVLYRKFARWHTVSFVIAEYTVNKRIDEVFDAYEKKRADAKRAREKAWLARTNRRRFETHIAALKSKVSRHDELRDLLSERAMACEGQEADELHAAATGHQDEAEKLKVEILRLERQWAHQQVFKLVDGLVNGSDDDAKKALAELNKIWRQIDWNIFVPKIVGDADRNRIVQLLGVMASNAQLGEARNAFAFVQKILNTYKRTWGKAA